LGMPPAQVGQLSETYPENDAHAPSARLAQSTIVRTNNRLIIPAVKFEPR
jgi:hypothetical protein